MLSKSTVTAWTRCCRPKS